MGGESSLFDALILPVSRARLEAYRSSKAWTDSDAVAAYVWNMEIAEAMYPSLQAFEITLRNSIHAGLVARTGTESWFDQPDLLHGHFERACIAKARRELTKNRKPHDAGRIIAELHLGFWATLFNSPYDASLWQPDRGQLIRTVFPHAPRRMRDRQKLLRQINRIRKFRNRVFHYEPIWNRNDLVDVHDAIHQMLAAVSPEMDALVRSIDRFPAVRATGFQNARQRLAASDTLPEH